MLHPATDGLRTSCDLRKLVAIPPVRAGCLQAHTSALGVPPMPAQLLILIAAAIAFMVWATTRFIKSEPYRCWHQEPEQPYDIDDAHTVMQALINCSIESCPAKYSA